MRVRGEQLAAFSAACIWFFVNWFNIARYRAKARKRELTPVGGGDHDGSTILAAWPFSPKPQACHCALTCQNLVPLEGNGSDTT
jgi:hypothetical protein